MTNFKIVVTANEIIVFKNNEKYWVYNKCFYAAPDIAEFYGVDYSELIFVN